MTDKEKWAFGVLFTCVVVAMLWVCAGCQTCRGFAADMGRLCEDVKYQIPPEQNK